VKNAGNGRTISSLLPSTFLDTNGGSVGSLGFSLRKANKGNNMNKIYVGMAVVGLKKRLASAMTRLHHWALLRGIR
jgi:hypothetical protein